MVETWAPVGAKMEAETEAVEAAAEAGLRGRKQKRGRRVQYWSKPKAAARAAH